MKTLNKNNKYNLNEIRLNFTKKETGELFKKSRKVLYCLNTETGNITAEIETPQNKKCQEVVSIPEDFWHLRLSKYSADSLFSNVLDHACAFINGEEHKSWTSW